MTNLTVFDLPIGELKDYANNSKIHDDANVEAIRNSIERFGMCDPIGVWRNADGAYEIVEGHGRKMALEQLGYDTVPCVDLSHLTDEERRVYSHVHNQTTLMTDLDIEIADLDFDGTEFDMEDFGFPAYNSLDDFFSEPLNDSGSVAQDQEQPMTAYELRVICSSEEERMTLKQELEDNEFTVFVI